VKHAKLGLPPRRAGDEMMATNEELMKEIDANLAFFETKLPELLVHHRNRYALLHERSIAGIYDTIRDAQTAGASLYEDRKYSVQKITDKPAELGVYSYALHLGNP
jgi:hypothetical protein